MQKGLVPGWCFSGAAEPGRLQPGGFAFGLSPWQQVLSGPWAVAVGCSEVYFKKTIQSNPLLRVTFIMQQSVPLPG